MQLGLWKRSVVYAVALWLIAFLVIALLVNLGVPSGTLPVGVVILLAALYVTWWFAARVRLISITQGLGVGVMWLGVNVLLDYLIIVLGFAGGDPAFFTVWVIWVRYVLLLLLPVILAARRRTA